MKLQANHQDITVEQGAFVAIDFTETDETFEGLNLFFVLSASDSLPTPLLIKDQDSLAVDGDKITVQLSTQNTDRQGSHWYELWVEWLPEQWSKEFKGRFIFTKSTNYNQ